MAAPSSVKVGLPPSAISFRRLFARASGEHVEALDRTGKRHRGVDVALGKMKAKSVGDQRSPLNTALRCFNNKIYEMGILCRIE